MTVPVDPSPALQQYAHPEKLVTTDWLAENLGKVGTGDLVVVESDEDVLLYETGHIPGAVKVDWHLDLNDPVTRDYVDGEGFARLMDASGISRDTTVVIYGDKSNWWAAYALWVFTLFGHRDVRLMNGGRKTWELEKRELTTAGPDVQRSNYPVPASDDSIRAYRDEVSFLSKQPLLWRAYDQLDLENLHDTVTEEALRGTVTFDKTLSVTLEQAIAYIDDDELVEVTPRIIRLRKRHLDPHERKRQARSEG